MTLQWDIGMYECMVRGNCIYFFKILFIFFRERGREGERGKDQCVVASHMPLQPRHMPWLGTERATLWFAAHTQSIELH